MSLGEVLIFVMATVLIAYTSVELLGRFITYKLSTVEFSEVPK